MEKSVIDVFKSFKWEQEPPQKKLKAVTSEPPALCVTVNGDYAAVGYHGNGIKLFSLSSGGFMRSQSLLRLEESCAFKTLNCAS